MATTKNGMRAGVRRVEPTDNPTAPTVSADRYAFTTEAEAWTAIADTLEMIEAMPPAWCDCCEITIGLCMVVTALEGDGLVDQSVAKAMCRRIAKALQFSVSRYLATPADWQARVLICRRFAEESR